MGSFRERLVAECEAGAVKGLYQAGMNIAILPHTPVMGVLLWGLYAHGLGNFEVHGPLTLCYPVLKGQPLPLSTGERPFDFCP